jgi:hypothetical protein
MREPQQQRKQIWVAGQEAVILRLDREHELAARLF